MKLFKSKKGAIIFGVIIFLFLIFLSLKNDNESKKEEKNITVENKDENVPFLDVDKLKDKLLEEGFSEKKETSSDGWTLLSFQRKIDKYEELVAIDLVGDKLFGFSITSSHFNLQPNKKKIKDNLDKMTMIVRNYILVEKLKNQMTYMSNRIPQETPKIRKGNMDDLQQLIKSLEIEGYRITTSNYDRSKDITVEVTN